MDNKFDTAFIPQQPLLKVDGNLRFRERVNLPLIIGFVCLFISVMVYGGLYFYEASMAHRVTVLEKELESKEEILQISEIDRYKAIDARITTAKGLLRGHVAFSAMLGLIEKITAENIGWTSLSYGSGENGTLNVSLTGEALNYSAVYVQAEAWRGIESLREVEVGMPVLNPENGIVSFSASFVVNPDLLQYSRTIAKGGEPPAPEAASIPVTVTDQAP
ncbi:MAG: hypothetical protein Q7S52_06050 [bacterium]|nr:hypothetical protein [bacterium]